MREGGVYCFKQRCFGIRIIIKWMTNICVQNLKTCRIKTPCVDTNKLSIFFSFANFCQYTYCVFHCKKNKQNNNYFFYNFVSSTNTR